MSDKPPIPGIPPLSGIQDPHTRAVLQALINGWQVRNGAIGDGGERFLTLNDLKTGLKAGAFGKPGTGPRGGVSAIAGAFGGLYDAIADSITGSRLWQRMTSRLDAIETPEWFRNRFGSAIKEEQLLRETEFEAFASNITTAIANLNGNEAIVRNALTAISTEQGALASDVTSLQIALNGTPGGGGEDGLIFKAEQAFEISANTAGDLEGYWGVKFDAAGRVYGVGYGIEGKGGTVDLSQFIVLANRFVIANPNTDVPYFPFIVDGNRILMNGQLYVGNTPLSTVAENATTPPINFIGNFSSAPSTAGLKKNSVYKDTANGNTYILPANGGAWQLWLEKGSNGTSGQRGTVNIAIGSYGAGQESSALEAAGYGSPVFGDVVTLTSPGTTRSWTGSSWNTFAAYITGNLIVDGTIYTKNIETNAVSGLAASVGAGRYLDKASYTNVVSTTTPSFIASHAAGAKALCTVALRFDSDSGSKKFFGVTVRRNGSSIASDSFYVNANSDFMFVRQIIDHSPVSGAIYSVDVSSYDSGDKYLWDPSISVSLFKK